MLIVKLLRDWVKLPLEVENAAVIETVPLGDWVVSHLPVNVPLPVLSSTVMYFWIKLPLRWPSSSSWVTPGALTVTLAVPLTVPVWESVALMVGWVGCGAADEAGVGWTADGAVF